MADRNKLVNQFLAERFGQNAAAQNDYILTYFYENINTEDFQNWLALYIARLEVNVTPQALEVAKMEVKKEREDRLNLAKELHDPTKVNQNGIDALAAAGVTPPKK